MTPKTKKTGPHYIANRYVIIIAVFLLWVVFLDKHSVVKHIAIKRNISRMEREIQTYRGLAEQNDSRLRELQHSSDALQRFARERYLMCAPNEDVFLVVE